MAVSADLPLPENISASPARYADTLKRELQLSALEVSLEGALRCTTNASDPLRMYQFSSGSLRCYIDLSGQDW